VQYLKSLSLEDLADIEVTSVSKKLEKLADAPAAVFVITSEDIRRSGVTSIPEALRMAPGVQVARLNANIWAITARGFNGQFANKLLVMIDGRAVYSPTYSGVHWNVQDLLFEDVERIEVIRGPGASLWGANAVNGVINIITRSAADTSGGLLVAGAGTEERGFGGVRYGARVGEGAHVRVYATWFDRDAGADYMGLGEHDDWRKCQGGFRSDWKLSEIHSFTFQGDVYASEAGMAGNYDTRTPPFKEYIVEDAELAGGNLLARWTGAFPDLGDLALQVYYNRTKHLSNLGDEIRDTFDVDFQHGFNLGERHDLLWGMACRWTRDKLGEARAVQFKPSKRSMDLFSLFFQDQVTLVENRLWLVLGAKLENGYFTDWEVQPTGRLLWRPGEMHTFWAAISKAVRTPSRAEIDGHINLSVVPPGAPNNPSPFPIAPYVDRNEDFASETLIAHEVGYRFQPSEKLFCDLALFYNDYPDLAAVESAGRLELAPEPPFILEAPRELRNNGDARTMGMELAATLAPLDWWKLHLSYSYMKMYMSDNVNMELVGDYTERQLGLRSVMDLPYDLELDIWPRYVDDLAGAGVRRYLTADIRLGWRPSRNLAFSLVGRNLLEGDHLEFLDSLTPVLSTGVERGVYGKVVWRF
ncbi:MAG: TonB-dependent receptor, partial [Desulfobacterales bacterium]|nr:TonB-dependent receptor [Desulfobacterales bacterium]